MTSRKEHPSNTRAPRSKSVWLHTLHGFAVVSLLSSGCGVENSVNLLSKGKLIPDCEDPSLQEGELCNPNGRSCEGLQGMCGPDEDENCCAASRVPAGAYVRGTDSSGSASQASNTGPAETVQ